METTNNVVSILTGTVGIAMIQDILGVIILILSIANILFNLGMRIYKKAKEKKYDEIDDEINNAVENLEKLEDKTNDKL